MSDSNNSNDESYPLARQRRREMEAARNRRLRDLRQQELNQYRAGAHFMDQVHSQHTADQQTLLQLMGLQYAHRQHVYNTDASPLRNQQAAHSPNRNFHNAAFPPNGGMDFPSGNTFSNGALPPPMHNAGAHSPIRPVNSAGFRNSAVDFPSAHFSPHRAGPNHPIFNAAFRNSTVDFPGAPFPLPHGAGPSPNHPIPIAEVPLLSHSAAPSQGTYPQQPFDANNGAGDAFHGLANNASIPLLSHSAAPSQNTYPQQPCDAAAANNGAAGAFHGFASDGPVPNSGHPLPAVFEQPTESNPGRQNTLPMGLGPPNDNEMNAWGPRGHLQQNISDQSPLDHQDEKSSKRSYPGKTPNDGDDTNSPPLKRLRASGAQDGIDVPEQAVQNSNHPVAALPIATMHDGVPTGTPLQSSTTNNEGMAPSSAIGSGAPTDASLPEVNNKCEEFPTRFEGAGSADDNRSNAQQLNHSEESLTDSQGGETMESMAGLSSNSEASSLTDSQCDETTANMAPNHQESQGEAMMALPGAAGDNMAPNHQESQGEAMMALPGAAGDNMAPNHQESQGEAMMALPGAAGDNMAPNHQESQGEAMMALPGAAAAAGAGALARRVPRTPERIFSQLASPPPTPLREYILQLARELGETNRPSREHIESAISIVRFEHDQGMDFMHLRDQHNRTNIDGGRALLAMHQHHANLEQRNHHHVQDAEHRNHHHDQDAEQRNHHHDQQAKQRQQHHDQVVEQRQQLHDDEKKQKQKIHDYKIKQDERKLTDAAVTQNANILCGFGVLYIVFSMYMWAGHHVMGFWTAPCSYFFEVCPAGENSWYSWIPFVTESICCFLSLLFLTAVIAIFTAGISLAPKEVKFAISVVMHGVFIYNLFSGTANQLMGICLVLVIIVPGLFFCVETFQFARNDGPRQIRGRNETGSNGL